MNSRDLLQQYLLGNLDSEGVKQLDQLLAGDPELRREFAAAAQLDTALREAAMERSLDDYQERLAPKQVRSTSGASSRWLIALCAVIAASSLIAVGMWQRSPSPIARLVSSENAAWESSLPTSPGSDLTAGILKLKSGIATIEFRSGAELILEAPAELEMVSDMRATLIAGAAVVEVPDSAKGFIVDSPDGYAIDFGTRFAVKVDQDSNETNFELIEGEIEVHQPVTGESLRLKEAGLAVAVSSQSLKLIEDTQLSESMRLPLEDNAGVLRIPMARWGAVIRDDSKRKYAIRPEFLVAKKVDGKWAMRSFFEFNLDSISSLEPKAVKLRLNQVPGGRGQATLLPRINRFAIYGLTNRDKANWKEVSTWEVAPSEVDGVLLGKFEIPRSQLRGVIELDTEDLLEFVKERAGSSITLILVRETNRTEGGGPSLTHTFASDQHPEAVGPLLEIRTR